MPGRARAGAADDARGFGRHGRSALSDHRNRRRFVLTDVLRRDALAAWTAGLRAVDAEASVRRALASRSDLDPSSPHSLVVAAGKAAAGMLRALAGPAGGIAHAIVVVSDGADVSALANVAGDLEIHYGGHPFPTPASDAAARRVLERVHGLSGGGHVLVLLSGGASALLETGLDGLAPDDLAAAYRALVSSGLPIATINLVRGCLSRIKAGGLARAAGEARTTTLAISDVEGDDPAVIGSGPTVEPLKPLFERCRRALGIVAEHRIPLPPAAFEVLGRGADRPRREPERPRASPDYTVIASIGDAVRGAEEELARRGHRIVSPTGGNRLYCDTTSAVARIVEAVGEARASCSGGERWAIVFGGETTIAVPSGTSGRGGRNLDVAAQLALRFAEGDRIAVVSGGTDGVDGSSRAAGAIIDGGTSRRCDAAGLPLRAALETFDTEPALEAAGDLVVTGPTGTNVGDLVVVVGAAK